ncbi:hypothetical protein JHK82_044230 [Glycine max]|nr:hypothetical protein JHK86_044580 [Glycine max]KAG4940553.1 hypothetical protein JHK87_044424 [Glycine soja]KAG4951318.1 hypothetical protein JHK85_045185 [Glycine max]KAG5099178.1 hypothetical protein JHK82_044230 [Glycine max]KAG5107783.1 hypothetical protein JHK84_044690 [Glycine max]
MASALQKAAEKFTSYKNHSFLPRFASGTPCTTSFPSRRRGSAATHISAESRNGAFGLAP